MKDVETQYHVTLCWWSYYSAVIKEAFSKKFKTIEIAVFVLQTMNWSHALGRFLGRTTYMCRGIHMHLGDAYNICKG